MNKHRAHRAYMSPYKYEYTSNYKLTLLFSYRIDCLHIKTEYKNLAVCLGKLDKRKTVQSESAILSN